MSRMSICTDFGSVVKYYDLRFGTGFELRNIDSCFGGVMLNPGWVNPP